jgi:thiamine transport system permease protein
LSASVAEAVLTSIAIALPAGLLSVLLALGLASLVRRLRLDLLRPRGAALVGVVGILLLAVPPVALSAGLFVALRPLANPFAIAAPLIVLVNGLMAMPLALRQVEPPLLVAAERYGRLADSLGIHGTNRLRWIEWPLLKRPVIVAFTVAAALSLGDLGVASLFGSGNLTTLPLLIFQRMGAYRLEEAASVSLLLAALVLLFFLIAHRWSGGGLARGR